MSKTISIYLGMKNSVYIQIFSYLRFFSSSYSSDEKQNMKLTIKQKQNTVKLFKYLILIYLSICHKTST